MAAVPAAALEREQAGAGWRAGLATAVIAVLALVLPVFLGGRTPFAIAYLADGLLAAGMAVVLIAVAIPGGWSPMPRGERWLWIAVAAGFSAYLILQVLPLPWLARALGPYPAAVWQPPELAPVTWSPNPGATLLGWAVFLALWTVACSVRVLPVRCLGWLLLAIAASGLFQALYGLLAHAGGSESVLGLWPRPNPEQMSGTFTNRNLYVGYLSLVGPLALFLWWLPGVPGIARLPRPFKLAGTVLAACLVALGMLAAGTRMGVMGGSIALLVSGYLWLYRWAVQPRLKRWSAAGLTAAIGLVLLWYGPEMVLGRFSDMGLENSRWDVWARMLGEIPARHWLTGIGLGGFDPVFRTIQSADLAGTWYYDAHNDLLQWLLEAGLAGALVLIGVLIGLWRRRGLTRMRAPLYGGLAGIALIGLVDFSWRMAGTQLVIAAYIGMLLRPVPQRSPRDGRPTRV